MEEILKALTEIKNDLDNQRQEIRKTGISVTEQVTQNISRMFEEKFLAIEKNQEILKEKVENQEKRLHALERQARKNNLVFFGIEEHEQSYESLQNNFINWAEKYLSIKLYNNDIREIRRIGKKNDKTRPIVVHFNTLDAKIKLLKQKRHLTETSYYIKEDYPKYVIEKRKELQEQLQLEREKGNEATIKYDKLIILKNNTKRKQPNSPELTTINNTDRSIQATKKNKIYGQHEKLKRSSSLSEGTIKPGLLNYVFKTNTNKNTEQNKQT